MAPMTAHIFVRYFPRRVPGYETRIAPYHNGQQKQQAQFAGVVSICRSLSQEKSPALQDLKVEKFSCYLLAFHRRFGGLQYFLAIRLVVVHECYDLAMIGIPRSVHLVNKCALVYTAGLL